jgi:hypothetical protein
MRGLSVKLWIHTLPPPGPVTITFHWPNFKISQTTQLDGGLIRSAASRSVRFAPPQTTETAD